MKKTNRKNAKDKPIIHEQWIEIRKQDGVFVTTFYPPNEQFEQERLDMDPPPTLIYRRFNFVHGVPAEYLWTDPPAQVEQLGGLFLQRIPVAAWPMVLNADRQAKHLRAHCATDTVARPECFGPCPCERCVAAAEQDAKPFG